MTPAEELRTAGRIVRDLAPTAVGAWPWDPRDIRASRPAYWQWVDLLAPCTAAAPLVCIFETAAIDAEVLSPDPNILALARAIIANAPAVPA